jgi:glycosyltransferase involved in cell wall biosynthesis
MISVCLATYNGEKYVKQQLSNVLSQLGKSDEVIVVDDCSTDHTIHILQEFGDPRISLHRNNTNQGILRSFEKALQQAAGEILFLCDQDDLWNEGKVETIKSVFSCSPEVTLVLSDAKVIDENGVPISDSWFSARAFAPGIAANLVKNRYLGCTMAFRRTVLRYVLPFPSDIPMHDMWIGMINQLYGNARFVPEALISYRRHSKNATGRHRSSISQMIKWRAALAKGLIFRALSIGINSGRV